MASLCTCFVQVESHHMVQARNISTTGTTCCFTVGCYGATSTKHTTWQQPGQLWAGGHLPSTQAQPLRYCLAHSGLRRLALALAWSKTGRDWLTKSFSDLTSSLPDADQNLPSYTDRLHFRYPVPIDADKHRRLHAFTCILDCCADTAYPPYFDPALPPISDCRHKTPETGRGRRENRPSHGHHATICMTDHQFRQIPLYTFQSPVWRQFAGAVT